MPISWEILVSSLESALGGLSYNLLVLFLLVAVIFSLQDKAHPEKLDRRVILGLRSLMLLRLIAALIFGIYWYAAVPPLAGAAPLERSIHLIGIVVFSWLWTRQSSKGQTHQTLIAVEFLAAMLVSAALILPWIGSTAYFNYTDADYLWSAACFITLILGAWQIFKGPQPGRTAGLILFLILFVGQLVHLLLAEPFGNMPLATQAADVLVLFILFSLPVREPKIEREAGTESLFPTEVPIYEIPTMSHKESEQPPHSPETEELARQTAQDLQADVCAFGALDFAHSKLEIHAAYNLLSNSRLELVDSPLDNFPRLVSSLARAQVLRLSAEQRPPDLDRMARLLNLSFPAHLLVAPIRNARDVRVWFVMLLRIEKPWQFTEEVNLEKATEGLSPKLIKALGYLDDEQFESEPVQENIPSPDQGDDAPTDLEKLEAENERYKQDVARLLAHIDELKRSGDGGAAAQIEIVTALQQENERLKSAVSSLEASRSAAQPVSIEADQAKEELRLAMMQVANLQEKLDATQKSFVVETGPQVGGKKISTGQVEVIASIAQELRQPLSSVLGYTELLLSESVGIIGALQRKFLERVRSSTERMNALIGDLIRIAELDKAGFSAQRKPVDLSAVIDDAIGQLRTQLQEKRIALRVDLPSKLPELNTDRDALQQILYHLLQNADAATPAEGAITLRAAIDAQPEFGDFVLLQVSDSGGGIPEEVLPSVFSRMYRTTNPLIQGVGDTGVGLTIAETLTQALGGRIWVESESGVGATFSVLLPLQPLKEETKPTAIGND